jgi:predicted ATP-grasp superfamily ATP-dependent carboligase
MMLKDRLYRALEGVVPVPRTRVPADESELEGTAAAVGYPAILKPLLRCLADSGEAGHPPFERTFGAKAVRARDFDELRAAYRAARAAGFTVLVQEEIEGPVSSLRSLGLYATRAGEVAATFTSEKIGQVPADFGDGLVVRSTSAPELIPLGARVVRHFGFYGMADIEFKWDTRERAYKLLDINPRPWLWMNLPAVCGVNLAYAAYLDALERPVTRSEFLQRDFQTRWVSVRGLLVHMVRSARAGRMGDAATSALRHFRGGRRVGPLWHRDDVLARMFLSPGFWRDSFRQGGHHAAPAPAADGMGSRLPVGGAAREAR